MKMGINADTALQKLNQYMLFSLTYKQTLYMFNNPTMECTKGKQLAVFPHRNSCKMSESIGTRQQRVAPHCLPVQRKEEGQTDPRWKNVWFDISENFELNAVQKKVQIQLWERAHVRLTICWSTVGTYGTASTVN